MSVNKSGGDVYQANFAAQGNSSDQHVVNVAPGGVGAVEGFGGDGNAFGFAHQDVRQDIDQSNHGFGGDAGNDNTYADTTVVVG